MLEFADVHLQMDTGPQSFISKISYPETFDLIPVTRPKPSLFVCNFGLAVLRNPLSLWNLKIVSGRVPQPEYYLTANWNNFEN